MGLGALEFLENRIIFVLHVGQLFGKRDSDLSHEIAFVSTPVVKCRSKCSSSRRDEAAEARDFK